MLNTASGCPRCSRTLGTCVSTRRPCTRSIPSLHQSQRTIALSVLRPSRSTDGGSPLDRARQAPRGAGRPLAATPAGSQRSSTSPEDDGAGQACIADLGRRPGLTGGGKNIVQRRGASPAGWTRSVSGHGYLHLSILVTIPDTHSLPSVRRNRALCPTREAPGASHLGGRPALARRVWTSTRHRMRGPTCRSTRWSKRATRLGAQRSAHRPAGR